MTLHKKKDRETKRNGMNAKKKKQGTRIGGLHFQIHNEGPILGQKGGKDQKVGGCHKKKKDIVHRTNALTSTV